MEEKQKYLIWCEANQFGNSEDVTDPCTREEAETAAYELAKDHLMSYAGLYGIPDDTNESLEEAGYESFDAVVDEHMDYGCEVYTGRTKYN